MMMTLNCYAEVFKQGIVHPESLKDMDWKDVKNLLCMNEYQTLNNQPSIASA
jgi:hypothetical protein